MQHSVLLITISGEDRPGLVRAISEVLVQQGANWEQSRMMNLSGRFVGLLQVQVDSSKASELEMALESLEDLQMTIAYGQPSPLPARTLQLNILGADHPGIISEISNVLASQEINVETLRTHTEPAADSGTILFRATAQLSMDQPLSLSDLQTSLESLAEDLMVTVEIAES